MQAFGLFVARLLLLRFRFVVPYNHFTLSLCDGIGLLSLQSRDGLGQYSQIILLCARACVRAQYVNNTPVRDKEGLCFQSGTEFKLG